VRGCCYSWVVATTPAPRLRATPRALGAVVALGMMAFLYVTTETLPIGLLPQIADGVDVSIPRAGFLMSGYAATVAIVSVPLALWTRKMDRRRLLLAILGVYVVAVLGTAAAPNYDLLLGARIVTALSQSLFWAIVAPTAASLFVPALRSRVVTLVFVGSSLAIIVGTPTGTWLGQHGGWRLSFVVLAVVGLGILGAVALLVPHFEYHESHAATGSHPDGRRYALLVLITGAGMAGYFTMSTYIAPFLSKITGVASSAVSIVLLAGGLAGVLGVMAAPRLLERAPRRALAVPFALIVADFLLLFAFGDVAVVAVPLLVLANVGIATFATMLTSHVLDVAPGSSDVASAGTSSAFNVGIGGGAALGALAVHGGSLRATPLIGACTTAIALGIVLAEPRLLRVRLRRTHAESPSA
jgi:DHA1 family inner membrane transport protein